jgi:hypothetical protein
MSGVVTVAVQLFLFDAAAEAAGVEEGSTFLGCLVNCLVCGLFLMTKELCSLLLSPCSKDILIGRVVHTT